MTHKLLTKFYSNAKKGSIEVVQLRRFLYNDNVSSSIVPVISYHNADKKKDEVIKQNNGKSGIYRWTNVINNKIYIGSSLNLSRRFKQYYNYSYITKPKCNVPIHCALLKYGCSNFKLEILEYCVISSLIEREQYYMNLLRPEYNVLKTAGSALGFKHNEATLKLFRSTRLGRKFSEATRLKLSANNHKSIAVILKNNETGVVTRFISKSKAAEFLGVSETTIRNFLKQDRICKGYTISM